MERQTQGDGDGEWAKICFVWTQCFTLLSDPPCSYDEGAVVLKIGREEPVASMDSSGKVIWARHNEVCVWGGQQVGKSEKRKHK